MKLQAIILTFILVLTFSLTACGNKDNKLKSGAADMKQTLAKLQTQLNEDKALDVKVSADKLEEAWATFEDSVKTKNASLYEKVEVPLGVIEAGAKVAPLDKDTLSKAAQDLDAVLTDIEKQ